MQVQTVLNVWDKTSSHQEKSQDHPWPISWPSLIMCILGAAKTGEYGEWATELLVLDESDQELEWTFQHLAERWRLERGPDSSVREMAIHPAYQEIIGMGERAIPLILRELEKNPDHWFWALRTITRQDPVPASSRGKIREMAAAWLRWGREHGYSL